MKKCAQCAEEIQDEAVVCRFCGREVAAVLSPKIVRHLNRVLLISALVVLVIVGVAAGVVRGRNTSQGWSQSDIEADVRECRSSYRDFIEKTKVSADWGDVAALYSLYTNRPEDMIAYGCDCAMHRLSETFPRERMWDKAYRYESGAAFTAAREECLKSGRANTAAENR